MKALFLVLLGAHVAVGLANHVWGKPAKGTGPRYLLTSVSQITLFLLGGYLAIEAQAITRSLLSPIFIGAGLVLGHLIFGLSLLIIHRSVEDATSYFLDFGSLWKFIVDHPYVMSRFVVVGVTEEIVWRAAAQPVVVESARGLLGDGAFPVAAGIVVVAAGFSLVHDHFFRNSMVVSTEFMAFALLLGVLYYLTGSLILVIIIHSVRDIEICYLEYILKIDEYGDEKRAAEDIERMYMRPLRHE